MEKKMITMRLTYSVVILHVFHLKNGNYLLHIYKVEHFLF